MPKTYLYAELLINIRQVTVFAILPSSCNEYTRIGLDAGHNILHLTHDEEESSITLPCPVVINNATLNIPPTPVTGLSFRLGAATQLPPKAEVYNANSIPWPASKLTSETHVACQSCGNRLIANATDWKDLPSGGWADMMDFWHCHKPTTENSNYDTAGSTKGYAASNVLGPKPGVGLVDTSHFLLAETNCIGIRRSNLNLPSTSMRHDGLREADQKSLSCESCREPVGVVDREYGNIRLFKWSLAVQRSQDTAWEKYSVPEIVSAQLLALIAEQSTYKFLVYSENTEEMKEVLLLWVFTPDLVYSTSTQLPQRATKIFYISIADPAAIPKHQNNKTEELQLPHHAITALHTSLKASTATLPPSAQHHQNWTIGLLPR